MLPGVLIREDTKDDLPALAAGMVHEVKNPLAAIHLHLQLLEGYASEIHETDTREKIQKKVGIIKKEILNLNRTLMEMIRLIKPQPVEKEVAFDINGLIAEIVEFLEVQALREGIDLHFKSQPLPQLPSVDPVFIKQIVMNLILNSIQAFQESDIPPEKRKLTVATGLKDQAVFISVSDNGPGIPDDVQQKIFEPFFSTKKEGSGLGLTLVRRMVQEMGGRIEIRSAPNQGTRCTIFLSAGKLLSADAS